MVRSWDCFDTLLARRYHYPKSVFSHISEILDDENFIDLRLMAEKNSSYKTLDDIYKLLPSYDKNLELEIETKLTYPIVENFNLVQDGDIIVSDMYLSEQEILDLLKHHGLNKDVKVYSSYGGKASGKIWEEIIKKHNIDYHIGDNLHSDVLHPRNYGINTLYFHGSNLSYQELLLERYDNYLAYWIKNTRLLNYYMPQYQRYIHARGSISYYYSTYWTVEYDGNIYLYTEIYNTLNNNEVSLYNKELDSYIHINKDTGISYLSKEGVRNIYANGHWIEYHSNCSRNDQKILWTEQSSFNIPILISAIYQLPSDQTIVFSYRDCFYMEMLYRSIYENKTCDTLHVSRNSYLYPYNTEYVDYLLNTIKDKCVIDLHGTGHSSGKFFKQYIPNQNMIFVCEHANTNSKNFKNKYMKLCFDKINDKDIENNKLNHNKKSSKLGLKCCCGTVLEKFNISPNMGPLAGWVDGEPFRKLIEHDRLICDTFYRCVESACSVSNFYKHKVNIEYNIELLDILLKKINEYTYSNSIIHTLWKN